MATGEHFRHQSEPGLLGVEIGRSKVRLALLDEQGRFVRDAVERPITTAGGPRKPISETASTRAALEMALGRLNIADRRSLMVGVTIGFPHCGVGSGPAITDWLTNLSSEVGEPILCAGQTGISYAPIRSLDFVGDVFRGLELPVDRVELAPVAASRCLKLAASSMTLGSGIAWSARLLNNEVLEAFETVDSSFDEIIHFSSGGREQILDHLGVDIDPVTCRDRGVSVPALAPAVGVALGLIKADPQNLMQARQVLGPGIAHQWDRTQPVHEQYNLVGTRRKTEIDLALAQSGPAGTNDTYSLRSLPDLDMVEQTHRFERPGDREAHNDYRYPAQGPAHATIERINGHSNNGHEASGFVPDSYLPNGRNGNGGQHNGPGVNTPGSNGPGVTDHSGNSHGMNGHGANGHGANGHSVNGDGGGAAGDTSPGMGLYGVGPGLNPVTDTGQPLRQLGANEQAHHSTTGPINARVRQSDDLAGIEAFAHAGSEESGRDFLASDIFLVTLVVSAVILALVWLFV